MTWGCHCGRWLFMGAYMQTFRCNNMYALRASVAGPQCLRFFFFEFNVEQWVFPRSSPQPNEMRIPLLCFDILWLFLANVDWKLENVAKDISAVLFWTEKRITIKGSLWFSWKLLFLLTFNRNFPISWLNGKQSKRSIIDCVVGRRCSIYLLRSSRYNHATVI